jgi:acetyl-CoA carboxylase carboxyltransferase component
MAREIRFPADLFESGERDDQANREVAAILAALPRDHLARRAFARERPTIDITNHLRDRRDLFHELMNVSWDHYRRKTSRHKHGRA